MSVPPAAMDGAADRHSDPPDRRRRARASAVAGPIYHTDAPDVESGLAGGRLSWRRRASLRAGRLGPRHGPPVQVRLTGRGGLVEAADGCLMGRAGDQLRVGPGFGGDLE